MSRGLGDVYKRQEDYCAAVDEGNEALLTAINNALVEMIEDGTVQEILDKYIAAE